MFDVDQECPSGARCQGKMYSDCAHRKIEIQCGLGFNGQIRDPRGIVLYCSFDLPGVGGTGVLPSFSCYFFLFLSAWASHIQCDPGAFITLCDNQVEMSKLLKTCPFDPEH